jgi:hypothetical protein
MGSLGQPKGDRVGNMSVERSVHMGQSICAGEQASMLEKSLRYFRMQRALGGPLLCCPRGRDGRAITAPRIEALGIEGLAAGLDDSLRRLRTQRRPAILRRQPMQVAADWSYTSRRKCRSVGLLRRMDFPTLGIFSSVSTGGAAAAVAVDMATSTGWTMPPGMYRTPARQEWNPVSARL